MIDESISVKDFFRQLLHRRDGVILVMASTVSVAMLCANLFGLPNHFIEFTSSPNWVVLWTFMPVIIFFVYIRLRQLLDSESVIADLMHVIVFTSVIGLFILKNLEAI